MAAPAVVDAPSATAALDTDVLIIGGGPTGMVAALCLDRLGVGSIVVERRESLHSHPKAHELSARSIEILAGLGIGHEELAAEASSFEDGSRILFCDTIGKEFGCIDLTAGGGADKYRRHLGSPVPYLNLSQVALENILRGHLLRSRHARWMTGQQWESLSESDSLVESRITDCRSGEPRTIRSRYLLCADGAASRSRAWLGIAMVGPEKLRDFMSASFEADLGPLVHTRGKLYFIFHPSAVGSVFIAHHIEKRWVFHTMVPTPYEKVEDYTEPVMRAKIHAALGRDDVEIEITSMSHWQMSAQVAARFRKGRAFLLGDAAHRFPPTGGLGMNSGIGDAHNLCWKLAAVLAGRAPDSLLDTYEAERRPVVQHNCDESRANFERLSEIAVAFGLDPRSIEKMSERLHSRPITSLPASGQRLVRRQVERYAASVLARYHKDPAVRDRVLSAIEAQRAHFDRIGLDLGYSYAAGALLCDGTPAPLGDHHVTDYLPSTRPGARFPHFWLDANRRRRSSHELIDYGRSTLVVGDAVRGSDEDGAITEAAARLGVKVTSLACAGVPLAWRGEAHALMEIAADGAMLLRPDGHVAWRQARGVTLSAELVESLIVEAYR